MKYIRKFLPFLFSLALTCNGAIALVNTALPVGGANSATTSAVSMSGSTLFAAVTVCLSSGAVVTDSSGNSWTAATDWNANIHAVTFWSVSPITSGSQTFTVTLTGGLCTIGVYGFSGTATSTPLDQQNGNAQFGFVSSIQPGLITTTTNGQVLIAELGFSQTNTPTINSSFTGLQTINFSSSVNEGMAMAYLIQATAGAINPTWSFTGSFPTTTGITSFKAGSATVSVFQPLPLFGVGN